MQWRRVLPLILACLLIGVSPNTARAGHLIVSANDGKWPSVDGQYRAADPVVPDTLVVLDVSGFPPKIVSQVEVHHSVIAPPMAVAISPDEKLALVSAPNHLDPNDKTKLVPEAFIQVIDLEATPIKLVERVALKSQPVGVSINRAGDLALAAHFNGTVSVLSIQGKRVTLLDTIKLGEPKSRVSHVNFSPDGKWAFATKRGEDTVAVLRVEGTTVPYTGRDVTVGVEPYGLDVFPDGTLVAVADHGHENGDNDEVTFIDLTRQPFRAIEHVTVGQTPEGVAISPDGKWMAASCINGTTLPKKSSPFWSEHGLLMLFSIKNGKATKVAEAPVGKNNQGVMFTPDGRDILVQNYAEEELAAYRLTGSGMEDTGVRFKLPGHPAAIRIAPR
jgi:DNA-binding beta-propeller fold protein YncE